MTCSSPRASTLLLVVLGGLLLAAVVIPTTPFCGPSKKTVVTCSRLSNVVTACYLYRQEYGRFPSASDEARLWRVLGGDNSRGLRFIEPFDAAPETVLDA